MTFWTRYKLAMLFMGAPESVVRSAMAKELGKTRKSIVLPITMPKEVEAPKPPRSRVIPGTSLNIPMPKGAAAPSTGLRLEPWDMPMDHPAPPPARIVDNSIARSINQPFTITNATKPFVEAARSDGVNVVKEKTSSDAKIGVVMFEEKDK